MFSIFKSVVQPPARASLYANRDFITIETVSGIDCDIVDPKGENVVLTHEVGETELGEAILKCLAVSRTPKRRAAPELYNYREIAENYKSWRQELMDRFGYKTQKTMFAQMKLFAISDNGFELAFRQKTQEKPQGWINAPIKPFLIERNQLPDQIGNRVREIINTAVVYKK